EDARVLRAPRRTRRELDRADLPASRVSGATGRRARRPDARLPARQRLAAARGGRVPAAGRPGPDRTLEARGVPVPAALSTIARVALRPITVLVSASGAPGTAALLRALRENGEREVRLVGTDKSERSIGRHLCDAFHVVPAGSDPAFADAVLEICEREGVDAVLPQSSFDLAG